MTRLKQVVFRPAVAATLVCGIVGASIASLGGFAQQRLSADIAGLARGAYDILVRPETSTGLDLAATRGLVEPNYLSFSGQGGVSLKQLDSIRSLSGVDVAAPISVVGQVTVSWMSPGITFAPIKESEAYRLTVTQGVTDGVTPKVVSRQQISVLLPGSSSANKQALTSVSGSPTTGDPSGWTVFAAPLPPSSSSVVAVDPIAEQKLIGRSVPALAQLGEIRSQSAGTFTASALNDTITAAIRSSKLTEVDDVSSAIPLRSPIPVVPVLVTAKDSAATSLTVRADLIAKGMAVDQLLTQSDPMTAMTNALGTRPPLSTQTREGPASVQGLTGSGLAVSFGTQPPLGSGTGAIPHVGGLLIDRPTYRDTTTVDGALHTTITPRGVVPITGPPVDLPLDPASGVGAVKTLGQEQSYRATSGLSGGRTALYPLRTFDPKDLAPTTPDEGRVTLGAYDVPDLVVDQSPLAPKGTVVGPTLNSAGLAVRPPAAIADIKDAALMRGAEPIDAIRVRVAGIDRVDAATEARVNDVASQISKMGLRADVVIGSSPQEVTVDVPEYIGANGQPQTLGTVQQRWTTMGAAQRVQSGVSAATITLVAIAALAALLIAISSQLLEFATSRSDAAVLQAMGWSPREVKRRLLTAPLIATAFAVIVVAVVWVLSPRDPWIGGIALIACLLTAVAAVLGARRAVSGPAWARLRSDNTANAIMIPKRVRTTTSMAGRARITSRARSFAIAGLIVTTIASVAVAVSTYDGRQRTAGPTLLASTLLRTLSADHQILLVLSAAITLLFATLLWRYELAHRGNEHHILRTAGWDDRDRRRYRLVALNWMLLPAALTGLAVTYAAHWIIHTNGRLWVTLSAGLATAILAAALLIFAARKDTESDEAR